MQSFSLTKRSCSFLGLSVRGNEAPQNSLIVMLEVVVRVLFFGRVPAGGGIVFFGLCGRHIKLCCVFKFRRR